MLGWETARRLEVVLLSRWFLTVSIEESLRAVSRHVLLPGSFGKNLLVFLTLEESRSHRELVIVTHSEG